MPVPVRARGERATTRAAAGPSARDSTQSVLQAWVRRSQSSNLRASCASLPGRVRARRCRGGRHAGTGTCGPCPRRAGRAWVRAPARLKALSVSAVRMQRGSAQRSLDPRPTKMAGYRTPSPNWRRTSGHLGQSGCATADPDARSSLGPACRSLALAALPDTTRAWLAGDLCRHLVESALAACSRRSTCRYASHATAWLSRVRICAAHTHSGRTAI